MGAFGFRRDWPRRAGECTLSELHPTDEVLEDEWRTGSKQAFSELFRRHYPGVVAYAHRFLDDTQAAEDIAQQAFLNVLRRTSGRGRFKSLVYTVTRNLALNERRRRGRRYVAKSGLGDREPSGETTQPLTELIREEEQSAFQSALAALPESEREAFTLKMTRKLTYAEVGEVMGLHPDAVRRRVTKAIKLLRETLSPRSSL